MIVVSTGHATLVLCGFYQLLLHSTITAIAMVMLEIVTEHPVVLIPPSTFKENEPVNEASCVVELSGHIQA